MTKRVLSLLALGVLLWVPIAAQAGEHPSGKDRSEEAGQSGTQGKSTSDPDAEANGGADKPGGEGGVDTSDQDGNNGCGNDDDFEDDNNGNCGGRRLGVSGTTTNRTTTSTTTTGSTTTTSGTTPTNSTTPTVGSASGVSVLGVTVERQPATASVAVGSDDTRVLGTAFVRSGGTLAATGAPVQALALLGVALIALGRAMRTA